MVPKGNYGKVRLKQLTDVFQAADRVKSAKQKYVDFLQISFLKLKKVFPRAGDMPPTFGQLGLDSGFVLYETYLPDRVYPDPAELRVAKLHDRAHVNNNFFITKIMVLHTFNHLAGFRWQRDEGNPQQGGRATVRMLINSIERKDIDYEI